MCGTAQGPAGPVGEVRFLRPTSDDSILRENEVGQCEQRMVDQDRFGRQPHTQGFECASDCAAPSTQLPKNIQQRVSKSETDAETSNQASHGYLQGLSIS